MERRLVHVLGVGVDALTVDQLLHRIDQLARGSLQHQVAYVNADCLNRTVFDRRYRAILHEADVVYADGMGVVWASQLTTRPLPERITLGDVLPEVCRLAVERRLRLFFLGAAPGVAERAAQQLQTRFPSLSIVGTHHGYFSAHESAAVIDAINEAQPHLLLVGMGVPRQEKWLWQHREQLRVPILWGVGALFDYYAGRVRRAPRWMGRVGLEWLFRLAVEPRRLWRRYVLGNLFFLLRAFGLLVSDAIFVTLAWLGAYAMRSQLNHLFGFEINPVHSYVAVIPLLVGVWLIVCAALGLYRRSASMSVWEDLTLVTGTTCLGLLLTIAVAFFLKELELGRSVTMLTAIILWVLMAVSRLCFRILERREARRGTSLRRALVIGTGPFARRVKAEIETWPIGYDVIGFVRADGEGFADGARALGTGEDLAQLIRRHRIDDVFAASTTMSLQEQMNLLSHVDSDRVNVHVTSAELEPVAQRIAMKRVAHVPLLDLPHLRPRRWYAWTKRGFDIVASSLGLLLCLPVCGVIALLIKLESRGPAVFVQRRVGRDGRWFLMYKFRTMFAEAPAYEVAPNDLTDPRVTRFGRFLRRWSLDELLQLVNVLKGEMSLVGPRPEMPFLVEQYQPWQAWRLGVAPGLTCLWQVVGRKELPLHHNLEYDLYYVRHRGWPLDLQILLRTVPAVFCRRGAF